MIGIIGAMEEEVEKLKEALCVEQELTRASMTFLKGSLGDKEVVVVRSGIGKVNAAICVQILVDVFHVDGVLNTGIAGSLDAAIDIGDIVISEDTLQHDMDATNFGYALGEVPRLGTLAFEADKRFVELAKRANQMVNPDISTFTGRIVSGDCFVSDKAVKNRIKENFQAYCTEMEGAAIAQAAYLNQIPFVIIRAISDKADDSAAMAYEEFEKKAIAHSVRLTEKFIELL